MKMFSLYSIGLLIIVLIDFSLFSLVDCKLVMICFSCSVGDMCNDFPEMHFSCLVRASSRASSSLKCDRINLGNGYVRYRERKSASRSFTCRSSFKLHGARYSKCVNGRWNEDMPICISK